MFKVDTFRLIKKTIRRFLSLSLIVLLGVAFMMGLLSSSTVMRKSVDKYNDEHNLLDIQLYSQYGFCVQDLFALRSSRGVDKIFASKMVDVNCVRSDGTQIVARVTESDRKVNAVKLVRGRLPIHDNECLIIHGLNDDNNYKIGDHLKMYLEDEDIGDYIKYQDYMIVGFVTSPEYSSNMFGTSNYKNMDLDLIVYVPNDNFKMEYFTTVYLTLKGSKDIVAYSEEYKQFIDDNRFYVEDVATNQQNYLKNKIVDEYQKELDDNIKTFEEEKIKGQNELDEARRKLEDANIQIVTYENTLKLLEEVIDKAKLTIEGSESVEEISSGLANDFGIDIDSFIDEYIKDNVKEELDEAQNAYDDIKSQLRSARYQYEKGLNDYKEGVLKYNEEIEKAEVEIRKAKQDLESLPKAKWTILTRDQHYSSYMYDGSCSQIQAIGITLPILFFLVAALVCMTTMARLIDEQRGQIGIYVALGYSKKQIICKYVIYAFLASIFGGLIGIFVGQALFPTVIYNTWRLLYQLPDMLILFPIKYALISILSFTTLMMLVSAIVAYNTLNDVPSNLLRPKTLKISKSIFLEKIKFIWERLSFTSKVTARNLFRYKSRFFMTVIGVAGCTALLVLGWGIKDSISDVIELQFGRIFAYNHQIYLENDHHILENIKALEDNLDNELVAPFMSYITKVYIDESDDTANVLVFNKRDANDVLSLRKSDRKTPTKIDNAGIVISEKFAKDNNIKKGEYITIESKNGVRESVRVAEICEMYFQHYIFMSDTFYESIFLEEVKNTNIAVSTTNKQQLYIDAKELLDFESIVNFDSLIKQFQITIESLDLIILVITITAGSLAFVVIMNLSQVNISERVREIATFKVLGFHNVEVNSYIFKEIMVLTIIGALLGLPLGVVFHHFVMNVITMDAVMFGMVIYYKSFMYAFIITIVFTIIVLFFMRKVLRNVNMIDSLKSVE